VIRSVQGERLPVMWKFGDCAFCNGSGKCEECEGTGTNPNFNSSVDVCPHCSASGKCPECGGSGLGPIGRPREGSVLRYAFLVAATLVGVFALMTAPSRVVKVIGFLVWMCLLWWVFSRNDKCRGPNPPSRF